MSQAKFTSTMRSFHERVYAVVRKIPKGKVATYGQVAALIGSPRASRQVGWALHALDAVQSENVPWQRVVNKQGYISIMNREHAADEQAWKLKLDGVKVVKKDKLWYVDLEKYIWKKEA
jgi:methylated-DNA-protein-cysteine methyltransferase related protein